ncbi:MAG: DinB family protein [Blastocatellia bacterium]|nr:DinB family protein [Blastocatellia bacterium]
MPAEPWLCGPIEGISPILMPAAHALLQAQQDIEQYASDLTPDQLWYEPNGVPSVGYHLRHIDGSSDRLLTYAKGEALSVAQFAFLKAEGSPESPLPTASELVVVAQKRIAALIEFLRLTPDENLFSERFVGRAKLSTNVIGLLFHIAEHTQRHVGSLIVVSKIVRS